MRVVLDIALLEVRRFLRDRSNIFFALIFPLMLVGMIGLQFGEEATSGHVAVVGVDDGALTERLVADLEERKAVVSSPSWDDALTQLARGRLDAVVGVDADAEAAHAAGEPVTLGLVPGSTNVARVVEQDVRGVVAAVRAEQAQRSALTTRGVPPAEADAALAEARSLVIAPRVEVSSGDAVSREFDQLGQFDLGASGQMLLFTFLITLSGATTLIQARRLGVVHRMMSGPLTSRQLIVGSTLGRWILGFFQGGYIMAASSLLFGVDWGNLALALLVLAVFALVAAGAAMLVGTLFEAENPAVGFSVGAGLVLGALGGAMFPLDLFPDTMRQVAQVVPHSWGYEALADLQRRGGGFVEILPELGVLLAMGVVLVGLGAWSLRRSLARAM